jgi:outer membrane protein
MRRVVLASCLGLLLVPTLVLAQEASVTSPWTATTRVIMTGVSDASDPGGYKVYSGFALEGEVSRTLSRLLSVAVSASTISREVEFGDRQTPKSNLGSIEVLPLTATLRAKFRPDDRFHPYVGAGLHLTFFPEKSGSLDSWDLTAKIGPVVHAGFEYDLSARATLNVDFRVSRLETDLKQGSTTVASLALHPSTLGVGFGFRF